MNVSHNITHHVPTLHKNNTHQEIQKVQMNIERRDDTPQETVVLQHTSKEKQEIESTVEKINEFNDPVHTNLEFVMHDELERYYVKVVNPMTDEVIREIPPEKMLDMYAKMAEYMGLLVDEKV